MPHISIRGNEMPESPIRKLASLAEAAKGRGIHVYHLNIGQPDLPTPRAALDAIRNINRTVLEYSPSQGYRSYREKLVGYYEKYDIHLDADDIIIDNYDGRTVDVQVTPYYLLDNESITCSGRQVTGTCTITEVTPGMNIEKVGLYVGRNIIVDDTRNLGQGGYTEVNTGLAAGQTVTLNVDLSGFSTNSTNNSLPQTGFVYARMGLKIAGIDAMIFTEPVPVKFN